MGLPKAPVPGFLGSSREGRPAPALSAWSWSRRLRAGLTKPERDAGSFVVLWKVLGARLGGPSEGRSCPERGFRGQPGFCHGPTVRKERDRAQKPEPGGGVLAPQWRQGQRESQVQLPGLRGKGLEENQRLISVSTHLPQGCDLGHIIAALSAWADSRVITAGPWHWLGTISSKMSFPSVQKIES